jgi:hypothetical protein
MTNIGQASCLTAAFLKTVLAGTGSLSERIRQWLRVSLSRTPHHPEGFD